MEPNEEPLAVEIEQDEKVRRISNEAIIGGLILLVLILGGVIWYMSSNPAPIASNPFATTTPTTPGDTTPGAPLNLNESGKYYDIVALYPSSTVLNKTASPRADAQAVSLMKQFEMNTIEAFKEQGNFANLTAEDIEMMGLDDRKQALEIKYLEKKGEHTVSYLYTMYMDTLGAHPNTYYRTFTFDLKTGEGMDIGDLFIPGATYLQTLSTQSRKLLPPILAAKAGVSVSELDLEYMNRGTTPDADNFQNWYVEGSDLVLEFPPYQVAAYALGAQTLRIPLSQLGATLAPEYR